MKSVEEILQSKVKLMIEVDKDYYEIIKNEVEKANGTGYKPFVIIANGTPITEGDLISRSELKSHKFLSPQVKVIGGRHNGKTKEQIVEAYQKGWNDCIDAITDNAPTVDAIVNTIEVRPQGEWYYSIDKGWECNQCHEIVKDMPTCMRKALYNFCPNCGAELRKGGAK